MHVCHADLRTFSWSYHQRGIVATVRTQHPNDTAWQRFLRTGPLALLPVRDSFSNVVWSTSVAEAARLQALTPQDFALEVNQVGPQQLPAVLPPPEDFRALPMPEDASQRSTFGRLALWTCLGWAQMTTRDLHALQALQGGCMPARNPLLPGASSDSFIPPPTVYAAEGAASQQSFPLALLGSGR